MIAIYKNIVKITSSTDNLSQPPQTRIISGFFTSDNKYYVNLSAQTCISTSFHNWPISSLRVSTGQVHRDCLFTMGGGEGGSSKPRLIQYTERPLAHIKILRNSKQV